MSKGLDTSALIFPEFIDYSTTKYRTIVMQFVYTKNWNDQILTQNKHDMMIFWKTGLNYRNF